MYHRILKNKSPNALNHIKITLTLAILKINDSLELTRVTLSSQSLQFSSKKIKYASKKFQYDLNGINAMLSSVHDHPKRS